ncbi:plant viral-response family protein (DUF716) [Tasmannia lanceolata]|uniref:plant viral-response family protein (DUF716) n=1 Tax=Tasmannia lanceolata TaxID=3420 RepID=UPI004063814C
MGLLTSCLGGLGFMVIGTWELISSSYTHLNPSPPSPPLPSLNKKTPTKNTPLFSPSTPLFLIALLSFLFILNSSISTVNASQSNDSLGLSLQLQSIALSSLFLLYSLVGFLTDFTNFPPLPSSIPNLIAAFAFAEEFLLYYLQRKDPTGLENRYFDLLLVPILICVLSTLLEINYPKSNFPSLCRGIGLILQGTWFIQMGFSFYTNFMAHGCVLYEKSRGNYTIKCKGHMDYHRSKAIATLQFNCHLAFIVVLIVGVYSIVNRMYGSRVDHVNYKPLSEELRELDGHSQFTLDSDEDEEIMMVENVKNQKEALPVNGMNGFVAH